ncbi:unnamed protein product [Toxocara canis]|uniref:DUF4062 domain-containing protein n=1 Tax=Toxocara canis TaxID=6265 RepID=A0A183UZI8_TOXCA|nr:unnamed protein product [Toxocara canis]
MLKVRVLDHRDIKRNADRTIKQPTAKRNSLNNGIFRRKSPSKNVKVETLIQPEAEVQGDTNEKADLKVAATFERVFQGHFVDIPSPLSKLVRVFTSSTFTDTTVERNALMEDVYPALKEFCRETHGLDFQVVDMRWGVRDEATDDHMTTKLCINEIGNCQRLSLGPNFVVVDMRWGVRDEATDDHMTTKLCINEIGNCQRLSLGPNFVVFLCQKYGYRPIPSEILCTELDMLKRALRDEHEDTSLLDTWYIEDANAVPALFILQPISSILVNFNNKRIPKLQKQDAAAWWEAEASMQNSLRKAAKICYDRGYLTHEQMHNYFMSVTEREVIHGILKAKNPNEHCLCYVRHINNIVCAEAQQLLSSLRDERVPAKLDAANIRRSTIEWAGRDGVDTVFHADYIKRFCNDFYESITQMVNKAMKKHDKFRDHLFSEVLQHLCNALSVSNMFFGRDDELKAAESYIRSNSNVPVVYYGENGCGKTSTLAKIAREIRNWYDRGEQPIIVLRFLGTSPASSSIAPLLTSVCDQELRGTSPTELSKLFLHFKKMTTLATDQKPLVFFVNFFI